VKTDKLKKRTEKFNEALLLYLGGYATHKKKSVNDWFAARDTVKNNKHLIPKF